MPPKIATRVARIGKIICHFGFKLYLSSKKPPITIIKAPRVKAII